MNFTLNGPRIAFILLALTALVVGYLLLAAPDNRNAFQRMGDAIEELPEGGNAAADQLKDRSPVQKMGDAVEDAGNNIERNVR